ncbi:MAG: thioredoxin-disulfide reductase [Lachnospiraceae bacterium]|jgi:thioredoxin reductase (NADPH)|nr:thioredoxin-disulfide reductase [Lachnospiraceae bacterium]MCI9095404.1 thioredoxin-disulfide reductase [Lachnospiraceae bacterium]MCI9204287.1 thioredoxin-disulfide reductase [Lachnospiraceae bacterium]
MFDVVIIGSGPAGISASIYAKRAGLKALTLEQNPLSGGQVLNTYEVDNYPGLSGINGFDMGMKFREHADKLGCEFQNAAVSRVRKVSAGEESGFILETSEGEIFTRTVVAAMGAVHAKLQVPGEEEFAGKGVSYCATCDGAFFRGKMTAVVGGGDVAVEDAIFLARSCEKVYLIHRRDELRAADILQKELKALPNIEILWNTVVKEISGEEKAQSLTLEDTRTGVRRSLAADGVFIAVGIVPSGDLMKDMVDHDEQGYFLAGEECATSVPGIFVAGDLRKKKLRQVVTAVADGANAIASVLDYLRSMI